MNAARGCKPMKQGGLIRGPGTGTSDSIPAEVLLGSYIQPADTTSKVMVSNKESMFTPEDQQALGAAVMEMIRGMTHRSAGEGEDEDDGYASGGQVQPPPPPPQSAVPQLTGMLGQGQRVLSGRARQLQEQERQALGMAEGGMVRPMLMEEWPAGYTNGGMIRRYASGGMVDVERDRLPTYASLDATRADLGRMTQQARSEAYAPTASSRRTQVMGAAPVQTFNAAREFCHS